MLSSRMAFRVFVSTGGGFHLEERSDLGSQRAEQGLYCSLHTQGSPALDQQKPKDGKIWIMKMLFIKTAAHVDAKFTAFNAVTSLRVSP